MNVKPEIKSIVKLELVTRKPKSYTEALHIVGEVLSKHGVQHTDIFDPRRACAKWTKQHMFAA